MNIRIVVLTSNEKIYQIHELHYTLTKKGYMSKSICNSIEEARKIKELINGKILIDFVQDNHNPLGL